jgi:hypothetical protein
VFQKYTKDRIKGTYRLLIIDGHGSHLTAEFDLFCKENSIIALCIPSYLSYLLQPLDVGCFARLKQLYSSIVEGKIQVGVNHIDKLDFLEAYTKAHIETFNSRIIQSSFAATGLVLYNPEQVLSKLNIELQIPTPPPTQGKDQGQGQTPWAPETLYNIL